MASATQLEFEKPIAELERQIDEIKKTAGDSQLSVAEHLAAGVTPGLVRLAVGIENITDILADLEAGFRAAKVS